MPFLGKPNNFTKLLPEKRIIVTHCTRYPVPCLPDFKLKCILYDHCAEDAEILMDDQKEHPLN